MKIRPVGDEIFHADRWINITKLTVADRNFANKPKNWLLWPIAGYYNSTGFTKVRAIAG